MPVFYQDDSKDNSENQLIESPEGEGEIVEEDKEPNVPISELRKVRSEAAKYRKQLRELESKIQEEQRVAELAKMEETDRLKALLSETESKATSYMKKVSIIAKHAAVINAASVIGFHNPKDAASIIDLDQIEVDEEGNVDDLKVMELVRTLAENKPYLTKKFQEIQEMAGYGPTNPASQNWPKPKFRTKDQIERLKQRSGEALKSGKVTSAIRLYNQAWEMERNVKKASSNGR